jgi:rhamnosyltransferase
VEYVAPGEVPELSPPGASILVPTFNAGPGFEELLRRLGAQETGFDYEIVVLDSGSTDGTAELAARHGARVHHVRSEDFDHGATRNLGISLCHGEYVALIVQDALPLDERWLAAMVENIERDDLVAGVYGRQVPRPDSGPLTRVLVNGWPTASLERREQFAGDAARYRALPPAERRTLAAFDNVSSCVRRSFWERIPFARTPFGEDARWARDVVEAGLKIVYEPRSAVIHAHERGPVYDLRRHYVEAQLLLDLFGLALVSNAALLVLNTLRSSAYLYRRLRRDEEIDAPGALLLAAKHALPAQTGAYLGTKSRRLARLLPRFSAALDRRLGRGV